MRALIHFFEASSVHLLMESFDEFLSLFLVFTNVAGMKTELKWDDESREGQAKKPYPIAP
jgi:hypothetical protein